jgi:hypothetical protein
VSTNVNGGYLSTEEALRFKKVFRPSSMRFLADSRPNSSKLDRQKFILEVLPPYITARSWVIYDPQ